jgi:hypothetical protein
MVRVLRGDEGIASWALLSRTVSHFVRIRNQSECRKSLENSDRSGRDETGQRRVLGVRWERGRDKIMGLCAREMRRHSTVKALSNASPTCNGQNNGEFLVLSNPKPTPHLFRLWIQSLLLAERQQAEFIWCPVQSTVTVSHSSFQS